MKNKKKTDNENNDKQNSPKKILISYVSTFTNIVIELQYFVLLLKHVMIFCILKTGKPFLQLQPYDSY